MKADLIRTVVAGGIPLLILLVLPPDEGVVAAATYFCGLLAAYIARRNGVDIDFPHVHKKEGARRSGEEN